MMQRTVGPDRAIWIPDDPAFQAGRREPTRDLRVNRHRLASSAHCWVSSRPGAANDRYAIPLQNRDRLVGDLRAMQDFVPYEHGKMTTCVCPLHAWQGIQRGQMERQVDYFIDKNCRHPFGTVDVSEFTGAGGEFLMRGLVGFSPEEREGLAARAAFFRNIFMPRNCGYGFSLNCVYAYALNLDPRNLLSNFLTPEEWDEEILRSMGYVLHQLPEGLDFSSFRVAVESGGVAPRSGESWIGSSILRFAGRRGDACGFADAVDDDGYLRQIRTIGEPQEASDEIMRMLDASAIPRAGENGASEILLVYVPPFSPRTYAVRRNELEIWRNREQIFNRTGLLRVEDETYNGLVYVYNWIERQYRRYPNFRVSEIHFGATEDKYQRDIDEERLRVARYSVNTKQAFTAKVFYEGVDERRVYNLGGRLIHSRYERAEREAVEATAEARIREREALDPGFHQMVVYERQDPQVYIQRLRRLAGYPSLYGRGEIGSRANIFHRALDRFPEDGLIVPDGSIGFFCMEIIFPLVAPYIATNPDTMLRDLFREFDTRIINWRIRHPGRQLMQTLPLGDAWGGNFYGDGGPKGFRFIIIGIFKPDPSEVPIRRVVLPRQSRIDPNRVAPDSLESAFEEIDRVMGKYHYLREHGLEEEAERWAFEFLAGDDGCLDINLGDMPELEFCRDLMQNWATYGPIPANGVIGPNGATMYSLDVVCPPRVADIQSWFGGFLVCNQLTRIWAAHPGWIHADANAEFGWGDHYSASGPVRARASSWNNMRIRVTGKVIDANIPGIRFLADYRRAVSEGRLAATTAGSEGPRVFSWVPSDFIETAPDPHAVLGVRGGDNYAIIRRAYQRSIAALDSLREQPDGHRAYMEHLRIVEWAGRELLGDRI